MKQWIVGMVAAAVLIGTLAAPVHAGKMQKRVRHLNKEIAHRNKVLDRHWNRLYVNHAHPTAKQRRKLDHWIAKHQRITNKRIAVRNSLAAGVRVKRHKH